MFCTKCGVNNPEQAHFCHSCGAAMVTVLWALVFLVALLVPSGLGGGAVRRAGPPACERPCLISFTRSGGLAPVNESLVVNDDGTLVRSPTLGRSIRGTVSSEELARLRALVGSDAFAVLDAAYVNPGVSDAVTYTVKTSAGEGHRDQRRSARRAGACD